MPEFVIIGVLGLIRIVTLSGERVALHRLGQRESGWLATMVIGFCGAAAVLWVMNLWQGAGSWRLVTLWIGAIYAVAFSLYTAAMARGPVSVVSPWSNATVVILWLLHPSGGILAILSLTLFALGAFLLTGYKVSAPVLWMLLSDGLLALARIADVHHVAESPVAYATNLFTAISIWMIIPLFLARKLGLVTRLVRTEPGWSFIAASSNAAAYLALFCLLRFLHPAIVEAISAVASSVAAFFGVFFFHEGGAVRKTTSSICMTLGTVLLLIATYGG